MSSDKVERLMTLLKVLVDTPRPLTADEIWAEVPGYAAEKEAARRTFERDKRELGQILQQPLRPEPIEGTDPPADGYRIRPEDAFLRDPGLTADERRALAVATSTVRLEGLDPRTAAGKLRADGAPNPIDAAGSTTELPADANVVELFRAVAERRTARFDYRGEAREVQPRGLRFARGRWYLDAHDVGRGADRQFRLDRIDGTVTTGPAGGFEDDGDRPTASRLDEPWTFGDRPAVTARVRVDSARADAARRTAGGAEVVDGPDGSVDLVVEVRNLEAFRSFVLGFGPDAEVLEPPEVRDDLVAWLRGIAGDAS